MPHVPGAAIHAQALLGFRRDLDAALRPVVQRLQAVLIRAATLAERTDDDQVIHLVPADRQMAVLAETGEIIQRFFVGPDLRSAYAADGVTPLAPYPRILNRWIVRVSLGVAGHHNRYIRRKLEHYPDILAYLERARLPVREQFDPTHTWLDRRGYQLSDRIWQNSIEVRTKMDALLLDSFRNRRSSLAVSRDLEAFLLPSQKGLTTTKPYGSKASYPALRLARTEIGRWHSVISHQAAEDNPFVDGWDWALSAAHPRIDICDDLATIGMDGQRLRDPYPLDGREPIPVVDSHPNCICHGKPFAGRSTTDIVVEYRQRMAARLPPPLTPVLPAEFVIALIGPALLRLFRGERNQEERIDVVT